VACCLVLAALVSVPLHAAESAKKNVKGGASTVMDKDWQKTFALMKERNDAVAGKLLNWIYVTETNMPMETQDLIRFADENPDWPRLGDFRDKIEDGVSTSGLKPHETAEWFRHNQPESVKGMKAFMAALLSFGRVEEARHALAAFWSEVELDKSETASVAARYRLYLSPSQSIARLDNLIWEGRYSEAEYMMPLVDEGTRAEGQARIAFARNASKSLKLFSAVPARLQKGQGLLFERARWHRRKNEDGRALDIINSALQGVVTHPEAWWNEQSILARRAMEDRDFSKAYSIVSRHQLKSGVDYAQAEWLRGWLELRFMKKPGAAYKRFSDLYGRVQSAISKSRAAYWTARAAEKSHLKDEAQAWDKLSAVYLSTYYGQLSYEKLYGTPSADKAKEAPPDPQVVKGFEGRELVHAVRILQHTGLERFIDSFLAKMLVEAKNKTDYQLIARLARETGRDYYAVGANKDIQQKLGGYILADGYPLLGQMPSGKPEKALVHAIIYRESMFNPNAASPAGALGLMQLMPATAKAVSKSAKARYKKERLTDDPGYNVLVGSAYLASLIDDYHGYFPFAIAAYNAGPSNVAAWVKSAGNPAKGAIDIVDWVEMISNYETRNYVQRVMEAWYMYRLRLHQKPMTVMDFGGGAP
jgi:soluble lytic murein transglycosylase